MNVRRTTVPAIVAAAAIVAFVPTAGAQTAQDSGPFVIGSAANENFVLELENGNTADGTRILAANIDNQKNQQWDLLPQDLTSENEMYQIVSRASTPERQVCLDRGGSNGEVIGKLCDTEATTQLWAIEPTTEGTSIVNADSAEAITFVSDNGPVRLDQASAENDRQQWTATPAPTGLVAG